MEDVQLCRSTTPLISTFTLSAASARVAKSDGARLSLHFLPPSSGVVWVSPTNPVVAGQGYALTPSSAPLKLLVDRDGENICRDWFAIADQGAPVLVVVEHRLFQGSKETYDAIRGNG